MNRRIASKIVLRDIELMGYAISAASYEKAVLVASRRGIRAAKSVARVVRVFVDGVDLS